MLLRDLLVNFIRANNPSVKLLAEISTAEAVWPTCHELRPDILILDIGLFLNQRQTDIDEMRKMPPRIRILVYSGSTTDTDIARAMQHGVDGSVSSVNGTAEFLKAINLLSRGENYFCSHSSRILAEIAAGKHGPGAKEDQRLSPREQEILQLIASGNTSKEIAATLGLSVATVDTHRRNAMSKIGARNAADLIRYGYEHGLIAGTVAALRVVGGIENQPPS